jgi:hypothetical protein
MNNFKCRSALQMAMNLFLLLPPFCRDGSIAACLCSTRYDYSSKQTSRNLPIADCSSGTLKYALFFRLFGYQSGGISCEHHLGEDP